MLGLPPHFLNIYFTGQMLGFGTGLVLSALLLGLLGRRVGRQSGNSAKYHQAAMALLWNLGGLVATLLALLNDRHARELALTAAVAHFIGAAFFPPAFIALWRRPGDEGSARAKACKFLCLISTLSAVVLTVAFIASLPPASVWPTGQALWSGLAGKLLAWHVAIVMGLGALILLRGRLNDFVTRFYAAATVVGAVIPALAMVIASPSSMSPPVLLVFCLLKEQSPLLILLGAIVFFSDFRFLNVYVKTSLQLLTGVAFALGFLLVMGQLKQLIGGITQYQDAAAISIATALLVLFLWCFVWVGPILGRMVDRRLFGEPDYRAALRDLWEQLNQRASGGNSTDLHSEGFAVYDGADEQERALDTVSKFVRRKLELEQVQVVLTSALDADHLEATLSSGEVYELPCGDAVKSKVGTGVEFLAPIRVKGVPVYVIAISPGALRRELLESEIRFLRAVAGQAGSRLEALQYEREKADRQNREERLRRQVMEAELRALRAQINPHFLFNSLNTIADLIVMDPAKADRMTVQLARVFRHILSNSDRQMTTVGEELEFLRTYLDIEAARFGDRMQIHFDVDSTAETESVPSLILQPVVENALKHGLAQKVGRGVLQVSVKREDGFLRLEVEDDGPGFQPSPGLMAFVPARIDPGKESVAAAPHVQSREPRGNGVGLRNISERLATIYSGQAKMLFERGTGGGCRVTLLLPRPTLLAAGVI